MIHSYTLEKLDIIQIKNSFNLIKFFNQSNVSGSNGYRYSYLNYQAFQTLTTRNIKNLAQYKFMKVQTIDYQSLLLKMQHNLIKI